MQIMSDSFDGAHGGKCTPSGLPASISVALFDLDGVLTSTAILHQKAWKQAFDHDSFGKDTATSSCRSPSETTCTVSAGARTGTACVRSCGRASSSPTDEVITKRSALPRTSSFYAEPEAW